MLELAHACSASLRVRGKKQTPHMVHSRTVHLPLGALLSPCTMWRTGKKQKQFDTDRQLLEKERKKLAEQLHALCPIEARARKYARRLGKLRPRELREISEFVNEPALGAAAQAALDGAAARLEACKRGIERLGEEELEQV